MVQGQLEVTTLAGTGKAAERGEDVVERVPFFMLSLDLPQARLFQDAMEKDIIPQARPPCCCHASRVRVGSSNAGTLGACVGRGCACAVPTGAP